MSKFVLDAMKGVIYNDDKQVRAVKIVALRLDEGFRARGSDKVFARLLQGFGRYRDDRSPVPVSEPPG